MTVGHAYARLKRHLTIVSHSTDVVELRRGAWNPTSLTLTDETGTGRLLGILRRLDGALSPAGIAEAEAVPLRDVESLVEELASLGLIETGPENALDFYLDEVAGNLRRPENAPARAEMDTILVGDESLTTQVAQLLERYTVTASQPITVATGEMRSGLLRVGRASLVDGLEFGQLAEPYAPWVGRTVAYLTEAVHPVELRGINRLALHHRFSLLHAAMDGPFLLLGPMVLPFRSACLECLETRVLMNLRESESYLRYKSALVDSRTTGGMAPADAILTAILAAHAASEVLNYQLTRTTFTIGKVLTIYLPTMEFTWNDVLRVPGCTACGAAPERDKDLYFEVRALLDEPA